MEWKLLLQIKPQTNGDIVTNCYKLLQIVETTVTNKATVTNTVTNKATKNWDTIVLGNC